MSETIPGPRSKLLPAGLVLIAAGLITPFPVEQAGRMIAAASDQSGVGLILSGALLIGSDLLRLLFFAGVACAIIGLLRNRRA